MATGEGGGEPPTADPGLSIGARVDAQGNQIREAAKWLIGSFAAVGAALIAGSQLSSIGKLPVCASTSIDCARLWIAGGGATIALLGVIWAVWTGVRLLAPSRRQASELQADWKEGDAAHDYFKANPGQLQGFKDLDDMEAQVAKAYEEQDNLVARAREAKGKTAKALEDKAWEAYEGVKGLVQRADDVVTIANHVEYVSFFRKKALRRLIFAAGAAALGIISFTWAANPPEVSSTAKLRNANLAKSDLSGANLSGVDFTGANLIGVDFTQANLEGADFTNADLGGVTWSGTVCPDGTNSDAADQTCENHLEP